MIVKCQFCKEANVQRKDLEVHYARCPMAVICDDCGCYIKTGDQSHSCTKSLRQEMMKMSQIFQGANLNYQNTIRQKDYRI